MLEDRRQKTENRRPGTIVPGRRGGQRGIALILALVMLALLGLLGSMVLSTSSTELRIVGNYRNTEDAFYAADGGVEYAQANGDIYTTLSVATVYNAANSFWPQPGSGSAADTNYNTVAIGDNAAAIKVQWLMCGAAPLGWGNQNEAALGETNPNSFNYYLINSTGSGQNNAEVRVETQVARVVAQCQ